MFMEQQHKPTTSPWKHQGWRTQMTVGIRPVSSSLCPPLYIIGMRRSISADIPIIGFDRRSQNGRSDDVTSARKTIRDVSIPAHRNRDDAPGEGRRVRGQRGSSPPSGVPDSHTSAPTDGCSRETHSIGSARGF